MSDLTNIFTDIADSIRSKSSTTDTFKPSEMADAIMDIPSGKDRPTDTMLLSGTPLVEWYGGKNNEAQQLALLSNNAANDVIDDEMYILSDTHAYDMGSSGNNATAYLVAAIPRQYISISFARILNFLNSFSAGQEELIYLSNNNVWYSVFGNDVQYSHGDFDFSEFHSFAISVDNNNHEAAYYIDGTRIGALPMNDASGQTVGPFNGYNAKGVVKYFAVVSGSQNETDIVANLNNIISFM